MPSTGGDQIPSPPEQPPAGAERDDAATDHEAVDDVDRTPEPPDPAGLLRAYGAHHYHFSGTLQLLGGDEQDGRTFGGQLWGAQLASGRIVLACLLVSFESIRMGGAMITARGVLDDGTPYETRGLLNWINALDDAFGWDQDPRGVWVVLSAQQVVLGSLVAGAAPPVAERRYALTNLAFEGATRADPDDPFGSGLEVRLNDASDADVRRVTLRRVPDHRAIVRRLRTLRETGVTAEAIVRTPRDSVSDDALISDLTYVLSVARGTKVQWLSREDRAADGRLVGRTLRAHVTKPFSPHPIVADASGPATREFAERGLITFRERRDTYDLFGAALPHEDRALNDATARRECQPPPLRRQAPT